MMTGKSDVGLPAADVSDGLLPCRKACWCRKENFCLEERVEKKMAILGKDAFIYRGKDATALFSKNCRSSSMHSIEYDTAYLL